MAALVRPAQMRSERQILGGKMSFDLAKFVFDTALAMNRIRAMELGLPDPHPRKLVHEVTCAYCKGEGYVNIERTDVDAVRGDQCMVCAGKGYIVEEFEL
jgi:hypothetical protein